NPPVHWREYFQAAPPSGRAALTPRAGNVNSILPTLRPWICTGPAEAHSDSSIRLAGNQVTASGRGTLRTVSRSDPLPLELSLFPYILRDIRQSAETASRAAASTSGN